MHGGNKIDGSSGTCADRGESPHDWILLHSLSDHVDVLSGISRNDCVVDVVVVKKCMSRTNVVQLKRSRGMKMAITNGLFFSLRWRGGGEEVLRKRHGRTYVVPP
uniref:Uncharacterized protein n=1 Tax=Peronospora matthiolae TaxID=2874970 RepID=A0AAV1T5S0_9STRA